MKMKNKYIRKNRNKIILTDLIKARVYLGADKSSFYPMSKLFLTGVRNKLCIFNLTSTINELKRLATLIVRVKSFNGKILFIGLPSYKKQKFIDICSKKGHFYVDDEFWIDGLLTNSLQILRHKMKFFKNHKNNEENDPLLLKEKFKGVLKMYKKPDLIVIFNHISIVDIINESSNTKIPVILFGNSNIDFKNVTYLIPGNFHSRKANKIYHKLIIYFLNHRVY